MLVIWGRNTSSNVQKAMWAIGEIGLAYERIDVGGAFGRTREPFYLAMNPNARVPTLQETDDAGEDGFSMWESNSIIRYLAGLHGGPLEPADPRTRARAQMWMDWQLSILGPAITPVFQGLVRTAPEKRNTALIEDCTRKSIDAAAILDAQLSRTAYLAGDDFSYGDIPPAVMINRFVKLVPDRPATPHLDRWVAALAERPAFLEHVGAIPLA